MTASAPGKVILFGEHFVVYGQPAVACAINLHAKVTVKERRGRTVHIYAPDLGVEAVFSDSTSPIEDAEIRSKLEPIFTVANKAMGFIGEKIGLDIEVRSTIPVASGLGSSAAVATATVEAVSKLMGRNLSRDDIFQIAMEAERMIHSNPSGIDPAVSTHGGALIYSKASGIKRLKVGCELPLVIGYTGIQRSTGELVRSVGLRRNSFPSIMDPLLKAGGAVALEASRSLELGELHKLGTLMDINHGLLSALGVSCMKLERLVDAARGSGALGAKLTGAGGGGCMVALSPPGKSYVIAEAIEEAGGRAFIAEINFEGVKSE